MYIWMKDVRCRNLLSIWSNFTHISVIKSHKHIISRQDFCCGWHDWNSAYFLCIVFGPLRSDWDVLFALFLMPLSRSKRRLLIHINTSQWTDRYCARSAMLMIAYIHYQHQQKLCLNSVSNASPVRNQTRV